MQERTAMPRKEVVDERPIGKRLYLRLACGHERLHNTCNPVPRAAHCMECPPPGRKAKREGPPLTAAERGRLGGLAGGRPRKGKYPLSMPWWEQALRDHAEAYPEFDLDKALEAMRQALRARRGR